MDCLTCGDAITDKPVAGKHRRCYHRDYHLARYQAKPAAKRSCARCGAAFTANHCRRTRCSDCRGKPLPHRRVVFAVKKCAQCSVEFRPEGRQRSYCTERCEKRADYQRRKADPARRARMRLASDASQKSRHAAGRNCVWCGEWKRGLRPYHFQCRPHVVACVVPDDHPSRSSRVPVDHPARWCGDTSMVHWCECAWCDDVVPSQFADRLYCTERCSRRAHAMRRRGREVNAPGTYTWGQVMHLFLKFDRCCAYCAAAIDGQPDPEHVIPLSRGGGNSIGNLLPACRRCNTEKRDMTPDEWAAWRAAKGRPALPWSWHDPRWSHLALATPTPRAA